MTFNEVMGLIFPSLIALLLYIKLQKKNISTPEIIFFSALLLLVTNIVCYIIMIYLVKTPSFEFTPLFTIKYSLMATVVAFFVAIAIRFIELNLNIKLRVESSDENN